MSIRLKDPLHEHDVENDEGHYRMNRLMLLASTMTVIASPVAAQTILSLNAIGSAVAQPDQAVATFEVQATKPDAASAQATVNQLITKALAAARGLSNLSVTTGSYNSYATVPADHQSTPSFTAEQSLTLIQPAAGGVPDAAFTNLLATLQSDGLLLTGLSGDLSATGRQKLQRVAVRNALTALRDEANDIATALHKKVGTLETLSVDTGGGIIPPIGPRMMAMPASAPQSAPDNVNVSARVSAKIELDAAS